MRHRAQNTKAVAYALWGNALVLIAILVALLGRDGSLKLAPSALAQSPIQPGGGGGLYLMPAQLSQNVWGCYVMDIDQQTLCGYAMTGSPPELRLVTARNFRYDRQLGSMNTHPDPSEVEAMVAKEKDSDRVTGRDPPKPESPEVTPRPE